MKRAVEALSISLFLGLFCVFAGLNVLAQSSTAIIREDGSVSGTDRIQRLGDVYTLTGNISGGIQVQRSNIVLDGAGYTISGRQSVGVDLSNGRGQDPNRPEISNVTIRNLRVVNCSHGIEVTNTGNNTIVGNYIAYCDPGINVMGMENNFLVTNNTIANNVNGISIAYSSGSQIVKWNNMVNDVVQSNNFIVVWYAAPPTIDSNYWSDYHGTDANGDGVGDTPYIIGEGMQDAHPLMSAVKMSISTIPETHDVPRVSILSPRNTSYAAVGDSYVSVPLTFEANASLSWVGYSLDGGANVTASNNTVVQIPVGSQYLTVYANDTAGNWAAPQTVYFTVAWNGGTPPPEPFPWLPVAAVSVVVAAVVAVAAVVYLKKRKQGGDT